MSHWFLSRYRTAEHRKAARRLAGRQQSPGRRNFCLASGGCKLEQTRMWLGLVDLSRILSGIFFRRVHPVSEMTGQNGQNGRFCDITKRPGFLKWRFLGRFRPLLLH